MNSEAARLDPLFYTLDQLTSIVVNYLPTLAVAISLLAIGIVVASAFRFIVIRLSAAVYALLSRTTSAERTRQIRLPWPISVIAANTIFWLTILFFLAVSSRILGLQGLANWIAAAASYLPRLLVCTVIVIGGYIIATLARDAVIRASGQAHTFSSLAFVSINVVAVLASLRHLGIDLVLVRSLLLIFVAAACGGIAFAFGRGASSSLDNIVAAYYVRRIYRRGQRVRIGAMEGEILEITPTAVVLDTHGGRAMIPAMIFNRDTSVLLGQEEDSSRA